MVDIPATKVQLSNWFLQGGLYAFAFMMYVSVIVFFASLLLAFVHRDKVAKAVTPS